MREEILRLDCISKSFPGIKVLNNVNLNLFRGEVLAVMGVNGAGKSTLMNILAGVYRSDGGRILFEEQEVKIHTPHDARNLGIRMVHQEVSLIPNLSIAENLYLGLEKQIVFLSKWQLEEQARALMQAVGLEINVAIPAQKLSVSQCQLIGFARALAADPRLIILDEPFSSLTDHESAILKNNIHRLTDLGISFIFITHQVHEAIELSDRIMVLRDGVSIGIYPKEACYEEFLISLMVGADLPPIVPRNFLSNSPVILRVNDLSERKRNKQISFELHEGEVLGLAGLVGSGRTTLLQLLFGLVSRSSGSIEVAGKLAQIRSPADAIQLGFGYIPEDRNLQGLVLQMSTRENMTLVSLFRVSMWRIINRRKERFFCNHWLKSISMQAKMSDMVVKNLSGGNQQKLVLAKWLSIRPKILLMDEPTKGVDLVSKQEINNHIMNLAKDGMSIILVSSELEELISLCDRVLIINEGQIKGEMSQSEIRSNLSTLILGH